MRCLLYWLFSCSRFFVLILFLFSPLVLYFSSSPLWRLCFHLCLFVFLLVCEQANTTQELLNLGGGTHSIDCHPSLFLYCPFHSLLSCLTFLPSYLLLSPYFLSFLLVSSPIFILLSTSYLSFPFFDVTPPLSLFSSPLLLFIFRFLFSTSPVLSSVGGALTQVPPIGGSGLQMQQTWERCFPASLPAVTSCDFFFFLSPLAVFTPSRGLPSLFPGEDGAPDDPPRSPPPLSLLSAVGVRRGST